MKIGFVSAILDGWTFDEVIDVAANYGYDCIEVACWPQGKAERRYGGVSHIDVKSLDERSVAKILKKCRESGVKISSLAYYPNALDPDKEKQTFVIDHMKAVMRASKMLDVNLVTTFIGRDQTKTVEENIEEVKKVWPPLMAYAESLGVRVAIENCPMLFGTDQWPGGQNLFTSPSNWRKVFSAIQSDFLGVNFDPSHFVWQQLDYIKPIYEFKDKIFHIHFKDIKLYPEQLADEGVLAYPLSFMAPKLIGLGDVNWSKFVSALTDIGFDGYACVEVEDKSYEGSKESILKSLGISRKYLSQFVG